ncbi:MAG: hypothetical protein NWE83_13590 [Candidatus Bathyarchaeota archaeon]|nr:hypothetical protein [Candidatus Bathyarchaeota archaeon]
MFKKKIDKGQLESTANNRFFFGWWTVLATAIMTAWGYGSWAYGFSA